MNRLRYRTRAQLLAAVSELVEVRRKVDDPSIPYDASEWGGLARQATATELHRELLRVLEECTARGVDVRAQLGFPGSSRA